MSGTPPSGGACGRSLARLFGRSVLATAFWVPLAICTALALVPKTFYATVSPLVGGAEPSGTGLHLLAFSYLSTALFAAHFQRGPLLAVVLWMLAFGVAIEVAQLFIEGRSSNFGDIAVDAGGIALGAAIYCALARFKVALA